MPQHPWDVIIAGGGPTGLSAALMLGRARRRVLVVDAGSPRNRFAAHMHGVLGAEGDPPGDLLARGRAEVAAYGVEVVTGSLERVEDEPAGLSIVTADGEVRSARALVIATGITDELPEIPGLAERWGHSVLHCPYCHGWEVRDERLGVLVTSPLGMHQAELIRQWSDRLTVFAAGILDEAALARLRSRGIRTVPTPVAAVLGEGAAISAVRLADGEEVEIDALFTAGTPRMHDGFVTGLALDRTESPMGSVLATDPMGRTSHERIWAAGNVVLPPGNVPMSVGAGAMTGAAVNAALVSWEFDAAQVPPAEYWEGRYAGSDRMWSGRVNRVLAEVAATLEPGRALDLGCGEGGDAVWLGLAGWEVTAVDISATAVARASAAARQAGLDPKRVRFIAADLTAMPDGEYDLVTASFLHSPVALARAEILRTATARVASGGTLLITSHADFPPWSNVSRPHAPRFLTPEEELAGLELDAAEWDVVAAETRSRVATGPDGQEATLDDAVVLVRRR